MINSEDADSKYKIKKGDCFLLLAIVASAVILLLFCRSTSARTGCNVTVTVNGSVFGSWSVESELTIEIPGTDGTNTLLISEGAASVIQADCPDLICVHHRPISYEGERIVCLPNKVVISITGPAGLAPADAISQ